MKKRRYSEEQIIAVLRQAEGGQTIAEVSREQGIAQDTFYRWRRKYLGGQPWTWSPHADGLGSIRLLAGT